MDKKYKYNNPMTNKGNKYWLGKKHSEETKKKMRKLKSKEHKQNLSKAHKGQVGWSKGFWCNLQS